MFKKILFAILCITCACITTIQAQLLHDVNWVFGYNCGINFSDRNNITQYITKADNWASTASISDEQGNLLMYIHHDKLPLNPYVDNYAVYNSLNILIDTLLNSYTNTNNVFFLTLGNKIILFHVGKFKSFFSCTLPYAECIKLYYSVFELDAQQRIIATSVNNIAIDDTINVGIAATKHANGKDWWLLAHEQTGKTPYRCNNNFYKLLISEDTIIGPTKQSIGSAACNNADIIGEMRFSPTGKYLASLLPNSGVVELFNFDRCTGTLYNHSILDSNINYKPTYCEFSPNENLLYVTESAVNGIERNSIIQYNINNIQSNVLYDVIEMGFAIGNISLASNNKLYIASARRFNTMLDSSIVNKNLSVIDYPNIVGNACNLSMFSYPLIAGCKSSVSLPKMPNYNLEALSIYEASAGADTVYINKEEQEGVQLGSPTVTGVAYQWQPAEGLSNTTIAQPYAMPNESRLYTVILTDTTIQHSCKTRIDSVYVIVNNCKEGKYGKETTYEAVKIFPNPANDKITVSSSNNCLTIKEVAIIDTRGRTIINTTETTITVSELAESLYMVRIRFTNGQTLTKKLVVYNQ